MKTQLILFVAGTLGLASAACNAASLSINSLQRRMLKSYFTPITTEERPN